MASKEKKEKSVYVKEYMAETMVPKKSDVAFVVEQDAKLKKLGISRDHPSNFTADAYRRGRQHVQYFIDEGLANSAELKKALDEEDPPTAEELKKRRAAKKAREAAETKEIVSELYKRLDAK